MPRITVAPGQTIVSTWGNTVFDQSVIAFNTPADRDAQWPTPADGAVCYILSNPGLWLRRGGTWKALPLGYLASATGPATQTDYGALTVVTSVSFPVIQNRRYRINASCVGNQITATGPSVFCRLADDQGQLLYLFNITNLATGSAAAGSAAMLYTPTTTKTATIQLYVSANAGGLRLIANAGSIFAEDIGL